MDKKTEKKQNNNQTKIINTDTHTQILLKFNAPSFCPLRKNQCISQCKRKQTCPECIQNAYKNILTRKEQPNNCSKYENVYFVHEEECCLNCYNSEYNARTREVHCILDPILEAKMKIKEASTRKEQMKLCIK